MGLFMSGFGVLSSDTRSRLRTLAERHKVRFVCDDEGAKFRFESDEGLDAAAFTNALRKNAALLVALQQEADLSDEDVEW